MNIGFMHLSSNGIFTLEQINEYGLTINYPKNYLDVLPRIFDYHKLANEIIQSRRNIGILDEGLPKELYQKIVGMDKNGWAPIFERISNPFGHTKYLQSIQKKARIEIDRINTLLKPSKQVKRQLPHVLLGNVFVPIGAIIAYDLDYGMDKNSPKRLEISVMSNILQSEFIQYVNNEWENIQILLSKLPGGRNSTKKPKIIPEPMEMKIVELRDKKIPYSEIVKIVDREFKQEIDVNSLSQINKRSKELISHFIELS